MKGKEVKKRTLPTPVRKASSPKVIATSTKRVRPVKRGGCCLKKRS